ncbi:hypothetical protein H2204_001045 [Knufia peltigerae]|nr:hypothetical protein H2204_001045 [Knufia peltigerae]
MVRNASQPQSSSTRRRPVRDVSSNSTSVGSTGAGAGAGSTTGTLENASTSTSLNRINPKAPKSHDRGPASTEDTQTDFSAMDILTSSGVAVPATAIDACTRDGFHLNNGTQTHGGVGVMLLDGETFVWTPWGTTVDTTTTSTETTRGREERFSTFLSRRGTLGLPPSSLGVLGLLYPKPDLLIVGTGEKLWMLSKETRKHIFEDLGIKVDVMDTPNAAAAYNLLATERGVDQVAALMIPLGFRGL